MDSRSKRYILVEIVLMWPFAVLSQSGAIAISPAEQYLQAAADQERAVLNLPPLRWDAALAAAAREHARQMVEHNAISHQFAAEPDLAARGSAAGARFSLISENVAESPSAIKIHEAWMSSEGHRHNLLDPAVDAVGIAVIARGRQLFAVEDFARSVPLLTLDQQAAALAAVISATGISVSIAEGDDRHLCLNSLEHVKVQGPSFVTRYTTAEVKHLPDQLQSQLASDRYSNAIVSACPEGNGDFALYSLAVLLYTAQTH